MQQIYILKQLSLESAIFKEAKNKTKKKRGPCDLIYMKVCRS